MGDMSKGEVTNADEVSAELNEYFRQNFRQISFEDAKSVVGSLALGKKVQALDDKFWVWETLEEATRPHCDTLSESDLQSVLGGFAVNNKGSEDLYDVLETRLFALQVTSPFMSGKNSVHQ